MVPRGRIRRDREPDTRPRASHGNSRRRTPHGPSLARTAPRPHGTVLTRTVALLVLVPAGSALACGGLVTPNGTVSLLRTTTLAAYHAGVEHYVTSFEFAGADATEVGSIVPLPGVPTKVIKGGDWTLQRLILETQPRRRAVALAAEDGAADSAAVLLQTQIDALDITVLEGWRGRRGNLGERSRVLPAARRSRGAGVLRRAQPDLHGREVRRRTRERAGRPAGAGHARSTSSSPRRTRGCRCASWRSDATKPTWCRRTYTCLTDREPATLPLAELPNGDPDQRGLIQEVSEPASTSLLADLRSDRGMRWMPTDDMWLTKIDVNTSAGDLVNDLAVDASGFGQPSAVAAGFGAAQLPARIAAVDRPVGGARRGRARGERGHRRSPSVRTDHRGLMPRARMRAAGIGALLALPAARRRGRAVAAGARDATRATADAHRPHPDPLLSVRPEGDRHRARPDDPVRRREHRPDRSRVHRGRRAGAAGARGRDRGPSRAAPRRDLDPAGRDGGHDGHVPLAAACSSAVTCPVTTPTACAARSRSRSGCLKRATGCHEPRPRQGFMRGRPRDPLREDRRRHPHRVPGVRRRPGRHPVRDGLGHAHREDVDGAEVRAVLHAPLVVRPCDGVRQTGRRALRSGVRGPAPVARGPDGRRARRDGRRRLRAHGGARRVRGRPDGHAVRRDVPRAHDRADRVRHQRVLEQRAGLPFCRARRGGPGGHRVPGAAGTTLGDEGARQGVPGGVVLTAPRRRRRRRRRGSPTTCGTPPARAP